MFLAESRERSSRDGVTYGSLIDYDSLKTSKTPEGWSATFRVIFSFLFLFLYSGAHTSVSWPQVLLDFLQHPF